jgi:2-polyprenyl-6-methoxyphenol hydroxylase-like FAD-dependent oxidoreductase
MADHQEGKVYDLAIVGAGILGCALAVAFGNQGRRVLLIERDLSEPNRIVGELLQPGGVQALEKLGMKGEFGLCYEGDGGREDRQKRREEGVLLREFRTLLWD